MNSIYIFSLGWLEAPLFDENSDKSNNMKSNKRNKKARPEIEGLDKQEEIKQLNSDALLGMRLLNALMVILRFSIKLI